MTSKLPPLDFKEEEAYKPFSEKVEVKVNRCKHKDVVYVNAVEIRCKSCSAGWSGANISELFNLFRNQ